MANQDSTYSPSDKLEPIDDANSEMDSVASTSHNSISNVEKLNQTRANVVREIICTERDYVKLLEHLVDVNISFLLTFFLLEKLFSVVSYWQGFLRQAQRRSDMFSKEKLTTIFGNLEDIFFFHKKFLGDLENCIIWDDLPSSRIGDCFLRHVRVLRVIEFQISLSKREILFFRK